MGKKGTERYKNPHAHEAQRQIASFAAKQYGHVTRGQLLGLGLTGRVITKRIEAGRIIRVHAGVYAVGVARNDAPARAAAAVLACGPGALLSHGSAASLWGISRRWSFPLHVTSAADRRRPNIATHRCATLTRADRRIQLGIWVTSPARTVLDHAPGLTDRQLQRAVSDARLNAHLKLPQLQDVLDRNPRHPGATRLRPYVDHPTGPTRSEFEDVFIAFTRRYGLPEPQLNVRVNGYEVDALFPAQRLIVELDSWTFHQGQPAFHNDRERDTVALVNGFATVRITWERLTGDPEREAQRLHQILRGRS